MKTFFELEIGYIIIALFFLAVTAIVTTRSFMPRVAFKRGMLLILSLVVIFIGFHYYITTKRMKQVAKEFEKGKIILCENRETFKGSQAIVINKKAGWSLKEGIFVNPKYHRKYHSARCIVAIRQDIK